MLVVGVVVSSVGAEKFNLYCVMVRVCLIISFFYLLFVCCFLLMGVAEMIGDGPGRGVVGRLVVM